STLYLSSYVHLLPPLVLEAFDYVAVLIELSPIFFLLHSSKAWRIWIMLICFFHLAIVLFLNIAFSLNFFTYLIFIDFRWLYKKLLNTPEIVRGSLLLSLVLFIFLRFYLIFSNQPMATFFPELKPI